MTSWDGYDPEKVVTGYPLQPYPSATDDDNHYRPSAPPVPRSYSNTDLPHRRISESTRNFCKKLGEVVLCVLAIIVVIGLLVGVGVFFVWLPKVPVSDIRVNSISIPSVNTSSLQSLVNWNVDFAVGNPTTHRVVIYNSFSVSASYQDVILSETTRTSPLILYGYGTTTTMSAVFSTSGTVWSDVYRGNSSGQSLGVVGLKFQLNGVAHFDHFHRPLTVTCKNVTVKFSPDSGVGTLANGSKRCSVHAPFVFCFSFKKSWPAHCMFL